MEIRRLERPADVREANRINRLAWRAAYRGIVEDSVIDRLDPADAATRAGEWFESLPGPSGVALCAAVDGRVRGYALFAWAETKPEIPAGDVELTELYVHPDRWGEGIGTALLDAGIERLPPSVEGVTLVVLADNDRGRRFYESRDFSRVGTGTYEIDGRDYRTAVYRRPC